jgi:nicotinamidase-related amidase
MDDGSLPVTGAKEDMNRLAKFLTDNGDKIDEVRCTLDSHHPCSIFHPLYWVDKNGNHPEPITVTGAQGRPLDSILFLDKVTGTNPLWRTTNPGWNDHAIKYIESLPKEYALTIWSYHCLIGSQGAAVYPPLFEALMEWEKKYFAVVNWVTKGCSMHTEHYGAVKAEVPLPDDDTTNTNSSFAELLEESDTLLVGGEASSHCVARTVTQLVEEFGEDYAKKIVLLTDCMSPVPGFENLYDDFINKMTQKGMRLSTSTQFFA